MQASPADVLRLYLIMVEQAVHPPPASLSSSAWPIITGPPPLTDWDNFLSILDTGGFTEPGRLNRTTGTRIVHPTAQVYIRSADYVTGYNKGRTIEAAFDRVGCQPPVGAGWPLVIVNGERVVLRVVSVTTPVMWIGQDEQNRRQDFTLNVRMSLADG